MSIVSDGYLFVPGCINGETLDALRAEADHLFHLKRAKQDALSEDEYLDKARRPREHGLGSVPGTSRKSCKHAL